MESSDGRRGGRSWPRLVAAGPVVALVLTSEVAVARDWDHYVMGGGHLAFSPPSPRVGAELSYALFHKHLGWWTGGYTDASVAADGRTWRHSIGPQLGWMFVGGDGGLVTRVREGDWQVGVCARALATLSILSAYVRGDFFPGLTTWEVGVLFKWPLLERTRRNTWREPFF